MDSEARAIFQDQSAPLAGDIAVAIRRGGSAKELAQRLEAIFALGYEAGRLAQREEDAKIVEVGSYADVPGAYRELLAWTIRESVLQGDKP